MRVWPVDDARGASDAAMPNDGPYGITDELNQEIFALRMQLQNEKQLSHMEYQKFTNRIQTLEDLLALQGQGSHG